MSGVNVKVLAELIRPFNGQSDVMEWLSKLELTAELREVDKLEKVIPLFLEGHAHNLYLELSTDEKKSAQSIKDALIKAFGVNRFKAYEQFVRRVWRDEPVDIYATDLKRLARLGRVASDDLIKTQFVVGLPSAVSKELRASDKIDEMTLPQLVARARDLVSELIPGDHVVAAPALGYGHVGKGDSGQGQGPRGRDRSSESKVGRAVRCFRCGGPHMVRSCPTKPKFECWTCGKEGHSARFCSQGNGRGGAAAQVPAAPQSMD